MTLALTIAAVALMIAFGYYLDRRAARAAEREAYNALKALWLDSLNNENNLDRED